MTPRQMKAAVCALAALSAGVAGNVMLLQRGATAHPAIRSRFEPWAHQPNAEHRPKPISEATSDGADVVRAVQRELRQRGYRSGIANGVAGPLTRAAIMAFQHDHGLPPTGAPSEDLLKVIVFESSGTMRRR
jgi:hypothetical protein